MHPALAQMGDCVDDVIEVPSRLAFRFPNDAGDVFIRHSASILRMLAVNDIDECRDFAAIGKAGLSPPFEVDTGHKFTLAKIVEDVFLLCLRDPKRHAAAGAAPIKAEYQARAFLCPAMNPGTDAQRPMDAMHRRGKPFQ